MQDTVPSIQKCIKHYLCPLGKIFGFGPHCKFRLGQLFAKVTIPHIPGKLTASLTPPVHEQRETPFWLWKWIKFSGKQALWSNPFYTIENKSENIKGSSCWKHFHIHMRNMFSGVFLFWIMGNSISQGYSVAMPCLCPCPILHNFGTKRTFMSGSHIFRNSQSLRISSWYFSTNNGTSLSSGKCMWSGLFIDPIAKVS